MCGINGFTWVDEELIRVMNEKTHNRGPDDRGVFTDNCVSLGHCRLSIIDLSAKGHQPMSNEDGNLWIVYNGEVYNFEGIREELLKRGHKFRSRTDTEVVIHAFEQWGNDCFDKFNGMWAFCIYDKINQELILCRDRFGIKPLYYHMDGERLIFSSMISAILAHGVKSVPNDKAIMRFLAYNLEDHSTCTFFENIYQLEPGGFLKYNLKTKEHHIEKWYSTKLRSNSDKEAIRSDFIESVRLRTIADVPIGSCLSGGIDSSAIVCTLDKILDYSVSTYSFVAPGSRIDESRYIQEVGKHTKAQQCYTQVTEEDFLEEFEDFVNALEEPVLGLSPYAQYRVMKLAHEHGAKVLLDGQGGDEIFAGYVYYFSYYYLELFRSFHWIELLRQMAMYVRNFRNVFPIAMFAFMMFPKAFKDLVWKTMLNSWINHELLENLLDDETDPRWEKMSLNEALKLTLFSTAIPHLLRWEDKNSMRWSIESRVPFLDVNLVERAMSLEVNAKLHNGKTKVILKKAVSDIIPEMIANRKDKIGFGTPVDDFFRRPKIIAFCRELVYSDTFRNRPYWKWKKVEKMFTAHIKNKKNNGREIWKWINLEVWLRAFSN
jgi:asparagine synthase (glutamine-hydrolysing)